MFYKSLVNAWGEEKALDYFDKLTDNILQYTESGSGPLNTVAEGKAAIGLGTTATAVAKINEGSPLKIIFFEEGAPYAVYGQTIIKGKEDRKAVRDVFDFLVNTFNYENCERYMEEDETARGHLRIGSLSSIAETRLPRLLTAFHKENPEVALSVTTGITDELLAGVLDRKLDGAFIAGSARHPDLVYRDFGGETLRLAAAGSSHISS